MNSLPIALALFGVTATAVALFPEPDQAQSIVSGVHQSRHDAALTGAPVGSPSTPGPRIEVVFALDTTASMGGLIHAAKEKIWSIATSMASAEEAPEIRMGLVGYRDRGDHYVTRVVDLSGDIDSVYATLMDFQAAGGGDVPESVNQALYDAVHGVSWSQGGGTYRVVFLVGDAPPHNDYDNDVSFAQTVAAARDKGIIVNTIQCGGDTLTAHAWKQIAQIGQGRYFQVDQGGGALAIVTPYDARLAELSAKLDETRVYYGSREAKARGERKLESADKLHAGASVESRARRAAFSVSASGSTSLMGEGELVDDISNGRVTLSAIEPDELPASMHDLSLREQQTLIATTARQRQTLKTEIEDLTRQRASFIRARLKDMDRVEDSLDAKIFSAVREQAAPRGLRYHEVAPAY